MIALTLREHACYYLLGEVVQEHVEVAGRIQGATNEGHVVGLTALVADTKDNADL